MFQTTNQYMSMSWALPCDTSSDHNSYQKKNRMKIIDYEYVDEDLYDYLYPNDHHWNFLSRDDRICAHICTYIYIHICIYIYI